MTYLENYNEWLKYVREEEREELISIKDNDNEIKERFSYPLAFGTAGMRGTLGMGIANMNVYTVARASKGLADYISTLGNDAKLKGVVVSYDTRRMSFEFALTTARVLAANGINAFLFENVRPVPMCSFAIRHLGCVAGVMITASHNPKEYNGYKVYGDDGAQMSPEATAVVVDFINKTSYFGIEQASVQMTTQAEISGMSNVGIADNIIVIGSAVDEVYYNTIQKLSLSEDAVKRVGKNIKIVYSPIHGSGYIPVTTILGKMNINVAVVEEQRLPDPDFSTVVMPNPEQPDALKLGIELADKLGSDIVIGTDPDCDRMGIAIRNEAGEFFLLNGNQIGAMLMDYVLMRNMQNNTMPSNPAVVKTIVTTKFADKIAKSYGATVFDVLTGFKFIGEKIKEWETTNEYTFMFGYEESYGYLSGTHARDKDAVVASMLFAEMACYYADINVKLCDRLDELFKMYGYFLETSKSIAFKGLDGMEKMANIMANMRENPFNDICGIKVVSISDFKKGTITFADGSEEKIKLPKSDVMKYDIGNDEWICVRPSGTEPKLKIYVSVQGKSKQESLQKNQELQDAMSKLIGA